MKKYKVLENVAIADIAFETYGKDLNELFENTALAIFEETTNLNKVEEKKKKEIKLKAENIEDLLFDFLSEILFLKDKDSFLFKTSKVNIKKFSLTAELKGEPINREKHELRNDIKAITLHMFKLEKTKEGFKATIVVDV